MKSDPKFVEQLVEIITREVLVAMAEQEAQAEDPDGYQCKFDCADQLCVRLCYDRMGNVVNAGAERLSSILGVFPPEQGLAKMIDHTLLKPDATQQEIAQLCLARGVVRKHREADRLGTAIRKVSAGEIWLSRGCLSRLIDDMATTAEIHPNPPHRSEVFSALTEREREVVALIAEGLHNRAIARKLGITENTVRHHLTAVFGKLGVADRLELAVYALRHRYAGRNRN